MLRLVKRLSPNAMVKWLDFIMKFLIMKLSMLLQTLYIIIFNDINCFIDLSWCCRIVHSHSDFIPGEYWGSFQDQSNQEKWNKLYCETLVGGKKKEQCKGSIQSVRI